MRQSLDELSRFVTSKLLDGRPLKIWRDWVPKKRNGSKRSGQIKYFLEIEVNGEPVVIHDASLPNAFRRMRNKIYRKYGEEI